MTFSHSGHQENWEDLDLKLFPWAVNVMYRKVAWVNPRGTLKASYVASDVPFTFNLYSTVHAILLTFYIILIFSDWINQSTMHSKCANINFFMHFNETKTNIINFSQFILPKPLQLYILAHDKDTRNITHMTSKFTHKTVTTALMLNLLPCHLKTFSHLH